jgi:hypothetical protein
MTRYRVAAAFLYIPFVMTLVAWGMGTELREILPLYVTIGIYCTGLFLLTVALAMDAWEVYAGKRRVKQLIDQKQRDRRQGKHAKSSG